MAVPFFSVDFRKGELSRFLFNGLQLWNMDKKNATTLDSILAERFPGKLITLFPSARMSFYLVLENHFQKGDEIIFPGMGFPLYVKIAKQLGINVKLVDVEPEHYTLDPKRLEEAITPDTKGIVATHLFGHPAKIDEIKAIADKHNIPVIEDCAQSFDSFYKNQEVGTFGHVGLISCSSLKIPTTLGGGIMLTEDEELHQKVNNSLKNPKYRKDLIATFRFYAKNMFLVLNSYPWIYSLLSHHVFGMINRKDPASLRKILYAHLLSDEPYDVWERPQLSKYQFSVGNKQFPRTREMTDQRRRNSAIIDEVLSDVPQVGVLKEDENAFWNRQYHVVRIPGKMNEVFDDMFNKGIHLMKEDVWDCSNYKFSEGLEYTIPVSQSHNPDLVRIQNNSYLSEATIRKVAEELKKSCEKAYNG